MVGPSQRPKKSRAGRILPWAGIVRAQDEIDQVLREEIAARRAGGYEGADDLLSQLVAARDEAGRPMSDQDLRDQIVTLLLAGHETTATTLAWTIAHLLHTPGLWERTRIFLTRVGTIILSLMVVLWFLASFPAPPAGATGPAIQYSVAGFLGRGLEYLFAPIGFNWQISIALVPGLAAREVAVSALGTVYAMSGAKDVAGALAPVIAQGWSIATGLSLLAWYVFAPQCLSTLAVVKRETNSWRYPLYMAAYLFALAYLGAFVTYRVALMLGGGAS